MAKTANILIIILELLGFRVSIGDRKWKIFAYYTQISNLITLVSSVVYVITGGAACLRYTSACMLTMTFVVTLFILVPFGSYAVSGAVGDLLCFVGGAFGGVAGSGGDHICVWDRDDVHELQGMF